MGFEHYFSKIEMIIREMDNKGRLSGWEMQDEHIVLWFAPSRDEGGWVIEVDTKTLKAIKLELPRIGEPVHATWSEPYDFDA